MVEHPLKVLIVDDNKDFARTMADVLVDEGCDVQVAHTGEEAIKFYDSQNFDLAFMDVQLPGISGVDGFLEIRKRSPQARVVMVTGYGTENVLDQALQSGVMAVLEKPLNWQAVLEFVENIKDDC